ncbi:MAG: flagellar basal body P-ring formation chaperone FlgA [Ignavibacteria bacterium]|jgi:flagella basal body P-ring formation protein FlgA|nr:flagellar basal body P-ring formation chaperone FlgA [Ignavibacteria bacterium]
MKRTIRILLLSLLITFPAFAQSTFKSETLTKAIASYVENANGCKSNVEVLQALRDVKLQQSGAKATIEHTGDLVGLCKVTLNFLLDGEVVHKEDVRIKVRIYAEVPMAKRFIPKDDVIKEEDISISLTEVTNIEPNDVVQLSDAIGKASRKGIAKGAVVQYKDISSGEAININRNDRVKLLHYSGSICIKANGFALEAGSAGDIIKVKGDNNQTLYGFIADDGNVIIEDKNLLINNKNN